MTLGTVAAGYAEGDATIPDSGRQGGRLFRIQRDLAAFFRMMWTGTHPLGYENIQFHQDDNFARRSTKASRGQGRIRGNSRQCESIDEFRTLQACFEKHPDGMARDPTLLARRLRRSNGATNGRGPRKARNGGGPIGTVHHSD